MILNIEIYGVLRKVELEKQGDNGYLVSIDGKQVEVEASFPSARILSLLIGGRVFGCVLDEDSTDPAMYVGTRTSAVSRGRSAVAHLEAQQRAAWPLALSRSKHPCRVVLFA